MAPLPGSRWPALGGPSHGTLTHPDRSAIPAVFLTGGSGFLGRQVAALLAATGTPLWSLVRPGTVTLRLPGATVVEGSLEDLPDLGGFLPPSAAVVHLAAQTGKARAPAFFRVNVEGTRRLLAAARDAGVSRVLFVSSVAAGYPDRAHYPYAQSKHFAEEAVRTCGMAWDIIRPTIVLGRGSPAGASLRRLAAGLVGVRFGSAAVDVQPIHVADAARLITAQLQRPAANQVLGLGGPEILSLDMLLRRMRELVRGRRGPFMTVPLGAMTVLLRALEPVLFNLLPFTAGQLSVFRVASTIPPPLVEFAAAEPLRTLDQMLADTVRV